ncbi:uncharacterized protein CYBJADRAFT_168553 [Cyberlindnera jadinii NRRL Y-1542]|uniref:Sodium/calcium exchanger membrane region domain-containing protein n=1 Tax=Cyberlindnera jadinii (strain ATCC 18201 / CBS 1600 / BCRC 20928 / JCM 3617 / NBRC 0987 / NRRL Y-1542) TaxID=983966 RepID=A0A1E4RZH2_CYBJN|nr:hypothetical protein CYBJADRAFT_168553 [Cyberlindnera jadinii NRRL Y-1542]ODV72647.1 hypothetical protein CYBJADRAFT_168553 [Cyberlindnera jadinii NRRL Y-1542]
MRWITLLFLLYSVRCHQSTSNTTYTLPEPQSSYTNDTDVESGMACHDIRLVPLLQQCQFAHDHCDEYRIGFINYVDWYYCAGHSSTARVPTILIYVLVLVSLFTTLGITASEFLCPNLDTIAKFFHMSESLAGVTLLALGNGSPDVFSTLEAMKVGSANLAIGELIGAALFISAVVVGSMAIVRPFKVAKRPFIRDVLFLLVCVSITAVFLSDGEISLPEAVAMIALYSTYVIFVLCWDWLVTKRRRMQLLDQKARNLFLDGTSKGNIREFQVEEQNEINDEHLWQELNPTGSAGIGVLDEQLQKQSVDSFNEWTKTSSVQRFRPSILGALDLNSRASEFKQMNSSGGISLDNLEAVTASKQQEREHEIRMSTAPQFTDNDDQHSLGEYEQRVQSAPAQYLYDYDEPFPGESVPNFFDAHDSLRKFFRTSTFWKNNGIVQTVFPTLYHFQDKMVPEKAISILCLPIVTMLRLTIPVTSTENGVVETKQLFGRQFFLLLLQCAISPFITMVLCFYDDALTAKFFLIPIMVSSALLACSFTLRRLPKLQTGFAVCLAGLGFIISISWISTIAAELIAIIKFFAVLLDLSDAILGITVFAVGNSLGDFISNFTIAKMGFPMMALSACFGGPLLNILLGIGGSALYVIPTSGENIPVHLSGTLVITGVTLMINLVLMLVIVPINGWQMSRPIGLAMVGLWCIATTISCVIELLR